MADDPPAESRPASRRDVLASVVGVGAALGVSGCLGVGRDGETGTGAEDNPGPGIDEPVLADDPRWERYGTAIARIGEATSLVLATRQRLIDFAEQQGIHRGGASVDALYDGFSESQSYLTSQLETARTALEDVRDSTPATSEYDDRWRARADAGQAYIRVLTAAFTHYEQIASFQQTLASGVFDQTGVVHPDAPDDPSQWGADDFRSREAANIVVPEVGVSVSAVPTTESAALRPTSGLDMAGSVTDLQGAIETASSQLSDAQMRVGDVVRELDVSVRGDPIQLDGYRFFSVSEAEQVLWLPVAIAAYHSGHNAYAAGQALAGGETLAPPSGPYQTAGDAFAAAAQAFSVAATALSEFDQELLVLCGASTAVFWRGTLSYASVSCLAQQEQAIAEMARERVTAQAGASGGADSGGGMEFQTSVTDQLSECDLPDTAPSPSAYTF